MKGTQKLFAVLTFLILALGFAPLLAQPLPYKGLDWLSLEPLIYYADAHEPDDTPSLAKHCPVDGPLQIHNFHTGEDQDWILFYAVAGQTYVIKTEARPIGALADTVLEL
jgi:hypothetical protein